MRGFKERGVEALEQGWEGKGPRGAWVVGALATTMAVAAVLRGVGGAWFGCSGQLSYELDYTDGTVFVRLLLLAATAGGLGDWFEGAGGRL